MKEYNTISKREKTFLILVVIIIIIIGLIIGLKIINYVASFNSTLLVVFTTIIFAFISAALFFLADKKREHAVLTKLFRYSSIFVTVITFLMFLETWYVFVELPRQYNEAIELIEKKPDMALKKLLTIENNHPNYKDTIVYIKNARVELGQKLLNLSKQKYRQKNYEESIRLAKRAMEYFKEAQANYNDATVYIKKARMGLLNTGQELLNLSKQKYRQKNYEESIRLAKRAMEYFKKAQTKEAKQQLSKAQQLSAKALKAEIKRLRLMTVTTNNFICRTVHAYAVAISWQLTSLLPRAEICRKKCHYACDILGEGTVVSVIKTFERGYVTYAVIKVVKPGDGCVGVYTGDEGITSKQWLKPVKLPLKPEIKKLLHIYQSNS